jgi:hypothetical protein
MVARAASRAYPWRRVMLGVLLVDARTDHRSNLIIIMMRYDLEE